MTLGLGPENRSLKSRVQQQSLKYISAPKGAVGNISVISRLDFYVFPKYQESLNQARSPFDDVGVSSKESSRSNPKPLLYLMAWPSASLSSLNSRDTL